MTNSIKKADIIRLLSGETCKVLNLPGSFLSNGSYEVIEVDTLSDGKFVEIKNKKRWVKPTDIAYSLTSTDHSDPTMNYFETFYDDEGEIHIIPKDVKSVELFEDKNGFKTIKLHYEGHLHNVINILIGENEIKNLKDKNG